MENGVAYRKNVHLELFWWRSLIPPWRTGNISGSRGREYLQPKQQVIFGLSIGQGLRVTSTTGPSLISVKDFNGIKDNMTLSNTG